MTSPHLEEVAQAMGIDPSKLSALLPGEVWSVDDPDEGMRCHELAIGFDWLGAGHPTAVLLGVSHAEVVVGVPIVTWDSQTPVLGVSKETRHPIGPLLEEWLTTEILAAQAERESTYTTCGRCEQVTPPEWMLDQELCQGCAAADGVVF